MLDRDQMAVGDAVAGQRRRGFRRSVLGTVVGLGVRGSRDFEQGCGDLEWFVGVGVKGS